MEIWHKYLAYILMFYNPEEKGFIAFGLNVVLRYIKKLQYIVLQGCKQISTLRQIVSFLRENINMYINFTYLYMYMLHVCIYKIQNMLPLLDR